MKKTAKTCILILLVLAVGISFLPVFSRNLAFAQDNATVTSQSQTVHRGMTFSVEVNLSANSGLSALLLVLKYDSSAMKLVNAEVGEALSNLTYFPTASSAWESANSANGNGIRFLWDGTTQDKSNGLLLTLTFESFLTAEEGEYPIQLAYDPDNTRSSMGVPATVTMNNGKITLTKGKFSVQYLNYDYTVLYEKDYNDGDVPQYKGVTPERPQDEMYSYQFNGWKGELSTDVIKYMADYILTPQAYNVRLYADGKLEKIISCCYGESMDLSYRPTMQEDYTFVCWFLDQECTQKLQSNIMPAHELSLYGFSKYNMRDDILPVLVLTPQQSGNSVTVEANFTANPGVSSMKLTLQYDRTNLTFKGFKRGDVFSGALTYTNADKIQLGSDGFYRETTAGALAANPFDFWLENNAGNSYECGTVLTMQFEIAANAPAAVYDITFSYDPRDIVFINDLNEMWSSKLDIYKASIALGTKDHWNEAVTGDSNINVDVTTQNGMPVNTQLVVEDVSNSLHLSTEATATIGEGQEIKKIYDISFVQDNQVVQPNGQVEVRIKLTEEERNSGNLALYIVGDDGQLHSAQSRVEGGEIVFTADTLAKFVIVGDVVNNGGNGGGDNNGGGGTTDTGGTNIWLYVAVILGVLVLVLIILLLLVAKRKKKQ